jgi:hypothetical protein
MEDLIEAMLASISGGRNTYVQVSFEFIGKFTTKLICFFLKFIYENI